MMEAEYNALSMTMREVLPFKHLVETVSIIVGYNEKETTTFKTTVWEDNIAALTLAWLEPGQITPRSKHYVVKMHWFQSKVIKEDIEIEKFITVEQKGRHVY
jgi:hypothetical protein